MAMITAIPMTVTAIPIAMHRSLSEYQFFLCLARSSFPGKRLVATNDSSPGNFADPTKWLVYAPL
jgi:hypothetical protein